MAAALTSAGVTISPARRTMGGEAMSIGELLASGERPAGPLLQAVQAQMDLERCARQLGKLNRKMVGDGRESLWLRDEGRGAGWATTGAESISDAVLALALWRAGVSLVRDDSGADVITLGDCLGNVSAAWVKSVYPVGESGAIACRLQHLASRIAYRAVTAAVAADAFGDTQGTQAAAAVDWCEWYASQGPAAAADAAAGLVAQWQAAHADGRRFERLQARCDTLASGNGRRAQVVAKVQHWALNVMGGMDCESAAMAAGFKGQAASKSGGAVSAYLRLASALRRMGLRVSAKRGAWATLPDEWEQAARRGGAAVDLAFRRERVGGESMPVCDAYGAPLGDYFCGRVSPVVAWPVLPALVSGLPQAASPSVAVSSLPPSAATLRRALRAWERRKLRGVLRVRPISQARPAASSSAAAGIVANDDTSAATSAASVTSAATPARPAVAAAAGLSTSTELRRVWLVDGAGVVCEPQACEWRTFRGVWAMNPPRIVRHVNR